MSSPSILTVPQTHNTAPVLEFRCLYTQDIRRKQKRWQDGRLKFHTFNKRVMVYDERSNFIGDTHWRDECGLNEGEELELERGGILVEVGECVGTQDQDLFELVDKRVREREERAAAKAATPSTTGRRASITRPQTSTPAGSLHLRPKPLNAVIGISTGHYGRAMVPNLSPFEQKHSKNKEDDCITRPSKRQKHNDTPIKSGYAQNLLGATLSLSSSRPVNTQTVRHEPLRTSIRPQAETIDLTREENGDGTDLGATSDHIHSSKVSTMVQKRKSPPAKSTYARSLTGAGLMLSGPITSATANPRKLHGTSQKSFPPYAGISDAPTHQKIETRQPITKLKPTRRAEPFPSSHPSRLATELLSLGAVQKVPSRRKNVDVHDPTATQLMAEQPVTVLRIKPKPPRQMMMLMDVSRLRRPDLDDNAQVAAELYMASEASNGSCPAGRNLAPSSNRALNTNNMIVPRPSTTITESPGPLEPQNTDHYSYTNLTERIAVSDKTAIGELPMLVDASTGRAEPNISTFADDSTEIDIGQQDSTGIVHDGALLLESGNSPSGVLEACSPPHQGASSGDNLTSAEKPQPRRKSASNFSSLERTEANILSEPVLRTAERGGTISTGSGMDVNADVSQLVKPGKARETGHHHQNPVASVKLNRKHTSEIVPAQETVELELAQGENIPSPHIEMATTATVIKNSPTSLSPISIADKVNYPTYAEKNADHSVASSTTRMLRRTALQAPRKTGARSMVNAAVPESNTLAAKTSARIPARAEIVSIKGDPDVYAPVRESASRGPWSRESFDLFGAWRPPGRAA